LYAAYAQRVRAAGSSVFVPVGRVFHVAPGNVDTVFVYSWALAYLCGNQNIVRVSGGASDVLQRLLARLADLMQHDPVLAAGNRFLTYEHDASISEAISLWATHRVLWGGDASVSLLRSLPLQPYASERTFATKFSYCILSIDAVLDCGDAALQKLAGGFFNDVFWFDQMACSSPQIVVWVGAPERLDAASQRFRDALAHEISRRGHRGAPSNAIHRLNFAFDLACSSDLRAEIMQKEFLSLRLAETAQWNRVACGAGLFTEVRADGLSAVAAFSGERDQTITCFGFGLEEIRDFARRAGARGVDRIVPVGEALAFDPVWDGYDLVADFLRQVTVRTS
jgi:hypothetical protein